MIDSLSLSWRMVSMSFPLSEKGHSLLVTSGNTTYYYESGEFYRYSPEVGNYDDSVPEPCTKDEVQGAIDSETLLSFYPTRCVDAGLSIDSLVNKS